MGPITIPSGVFQGGEEIPSGTFHCDEGIACADVR